MAYRGSYSRLPPLSTGTETVPIQEDSQLRPVNAYGASKLMFEQLLDWYETLHGLRTVRFRYFNVAGAWPGGELGRHTSPRRISSPHTVCHGCRRGTFRSVRWRLSDQRWDVHPRLHSRDGSGSSSQAGPRVAVERGSGGIFNLGNGQGYSNLEVVRTCAGVTGRDIDIQIGPRRLGDPAVLIASSAKANEVMGGVRADPGSTRSLGCLGLAPDRRSVLGVPPL